MCSAGFRWALCLSITTAEQVFLLIDPLVVPHERRGGWLVEVSPPVKEPTNPLLREDMLWDDRWDNTYPTARYDPESGKYRMWYNGFVGGKPAHPSWSSELPSPLRPWPRAMGGTMYAESRDGLRWEKPSLDAVAFPWNGTAEAPAAGGNNLVLMSPGNPNRGVMYDLREANASRRYKAFGSFYAGDGPGRGLCRGPGSRAPVDGQDGTAWPSCHNLGVAYSGDGIHFDHAQDEGAYDPPPPRQRNQPGLDLVGQNDGALDLAMYDPDLPPSTPGGGGFSPGVQIFNGRQGYEVYTVQPWRLPSYRPGYYLATAMFYNTSGPDGFVQCELLQTTDFGQRVAPEGTQFIPRGPVGAFDSHTVYTAWHGDSGPLLDPANNQTQLFYYAGGNGPHSGQRDDSIGLARGPTHAPAGLRVLPSLAAGLRTLCTLPLSWSPSACRESEEPGLELLASVGSRAGASTTSADLQQHMRVAISGMGLDLSLTGPGTPEQVLHSMEVEIRASVHVVIYALRL
eukprot:gene2935-3513_t